MINYRNNGITLDPTLDAKLMLIWRNDRDLIRYFRQNDQITEAVHLDYIYHANKHQDVRLYMIIKSSKPIGVCGLTSIDLIHGTAEWSSYVVNMDEIAETLANRNLFDHAFLHLRLRKVWAEIFSTNRDKIQIAQALRMQLEGIRRGQYFKNGEAVDGHMYGITAEGWRNL